MRTLFTVTLILTAGCVDPAGDLEAFQKRIAQKPIKDAGPDVVVPDAGACEVAPGFVEGQFLLAISASISPPNPIVSLTDVTTPAFQDGTGIALSAQPLAASDRTTPVGPAISFGPFPVGASGRFRADLPGLTVSGDANPITPGAAITADLVLYGSLCAGSSFFCGTVSGQVTSPIMLDLDGSTFTLTPLGDGGAIPTQPAINCRGTLADPL